MGKPALPGGGMRGGAPAVRPTAPVNAPCDASGRANHRRLHWCRRLWRSWRHISSRARPRQQARGGARLRQQACGTRSHPRTRHDSNGGQLAVRRQRAVSIQNQALTLLQRAIGLGLAAALSSARHGRGRMSGAVEVWRRRRRRRAAENPGPGCGKNREASGACANNSRAYLPTPAVGEEGAGREGSSALLGAGLCRVHALQGIHNDPHHRSIREQRDLLSRRHIQLVRPGEPCDRYQGGAHGPGCHQQRWPHGRSAARLRIPARAS